MNDKNYHYSMSDIIATMAINGATKEELDRAIKYSATVIDAERARKDLGIDELEKKYMARKEPKTPEEELDMVDAFFDKYDALICAAPRKEFLGMLSELNDAMVCIEGHCVGETESDTNLKEAEAHITHVALILAQMWAYKNQSDKGE